MIDRHIALAAAGLVVAGEHRDPFQQRRLAGPVLADDDGYRAIETQLKVILQQGKAERIGLTVGDARRIKPDTLEVRRRQIDRPISSCHTRFPITDAVRRSNSSLTLWHRDWNITRTISHGDRCRAAPMPSSARPS